MGEDMVRAPSRVLSSSAEITQAQVEELLPEIPAPSVTYADHSYPAYSSKQLHEYALACVKALIAFATPTPEELALREASVKCANDLHSNARRIDLLQAALAYARSMEERTDG